MSTFARLRNPEYTGSNRCIPCTIANAGIATLLSAGIFTLGIVLFNLSNELSATLTAGFLVFSLATIYFRGYLIPGTPELTQRYFPRRVLAWFDKSPSTNLEESSISVNPEEVLRTADAVEPCRNESDLCLTPTFKTVWRDHISDYRGQQLGDTALADALGVSLDDDRIQFDHRGSGVLARTTSAVIGQWSSNAAIIADVAAATTLDTRYPDWEQLTAAEKARVLLSLRIFLEDCPTCGGSVHVEQDVVESCCRSHDVIAAVCQSCETRLFEMEWDDPVNASTQDEPRPQQQPA